MTHTHQGAHHLLAHLPAEPIAAVVLSAAGVLTSWAGYQSALWDGEQLTHYSRSATQRVAASQAALDGGVTRAVEVGLFRAWAEARAKGDTQLAAFYEARFPADLRRAFQAWIADRPLENPRAAATPFALRSYAPRGIATATALERDADREFQAAITAKHTADGYLRAGVVLASAMFFAGIGQVFKQPRARLLLAVTSILALGFGGFLVVTLPVLALGLQH